MTEPSARPLNVPLTASLLSLLMIVKTSPVVGMNPSEMLSVASASVTLPVTSSWSYCVPTVAPLSSTEKTDPLSVSRLPVVITPGPLPGARVPMAEICTIGRVPVPFSVPSTNTFALVASEPSTCRMPAPTLTLPVFAFVPDSTMRPSPFLSKSTDPLMAPEMVRVSPDATSNDSLFDAREIGPAMVLSPETLITLLLFETGTPFNCSDLVAGRVMPPASSSEAPEFTETALETAGSPKALEWVALRKPALTETSPAYASLLPASVVRLLAA